MRGPRSLFSKLFLGNTLLILAVLGTCAYLIVQHVQRSYAEQVRQELRLHAHLLESVIRGQFGPDQADDLDRSVKQFAAATDNQVRITLILPDGRVLADSQAAPGTMESHAARPEVIQAIASGWGEEIHYSKTLQQFQRYAALRVGPAEAPSGVIRVSMPVRMITARANAFSRIVWTIVLLGALAAILFALGLARLWSWPIRRITVIARSLSKGDLSARARVAGPRELATLSASLNDMRDHIADQLATIDRQRRTLESLLAQLHEGVIVAGSNGRILLINPSAVRMLGISGDPAEKARSLLGQAIEQCVLQHDLQELLLEPKRGGSAGTDKPADEPSVSREVRIQIEEEDGELVLMARASGIVLPVPAANGGSPERSDIGRMLVLSDITQISRMVRIKTDFAANASHELRTPLSAIRAAVETLLGLDLQKDQESAKRFLSMIDRHSTRMQQMVSDLLDLSQIESSPGQFRPQTLTLPAVIDDLHARFAEKLAARNLEWSLQADPELRTIEASPHLLRVVLDNLVDNAIKFTGPGGRVQISSQKAVNEAGKVDAVIISVEDTGCGIAEEEQERVFERFYQVEKARSGPDRGTGLGLSIVRHAVAAMHGRVTLTSRVGEGTCVTVAIPQRL
ncbi:MAG: ATP-binding protein [Phycisphaerae bacterium]|nr:ATP-binding protein [Phycisphaerae bacterium]